MGSSITQWNQQNKTNDKTSEMKVLEKAKMLEKKRLKEGWRYIMVAPHLELFVPCDKDGNPTKEGRRRIKAVLDR